jgi:hypothetical protein
MGLLRLDEWLGCRVDPARWSGLRRLSGIPAGKTPFQKSNAPAKGLMRVPKTELAGKFETQENKNNKNQKHENSN